MQNKGVTGKLEAWLTFFCANEPEYIVELITAYPEFKLLYEDVYRLCLNTEKVMEMFSEELRMLDVNTTQFMIDTMQEKIDEQQGKIDDWYSIKNPFSYYEETIEQIILIFYLLFFCHPFSSYF